MHVVSEIEPGTNTAVVTLRGELDAHDASRLRDVLTAAIGEVSAEGRDGRRLVLDLTGVAFLDSTVLGTMIGALRRIREAGGELRIVLPETPARRIFDITGLEPVLNVYPTREAALGRAPDH
jgi:anti-sigma B factor antagonist